MTILNQRAFTLADNPGNEFTDGLPASLNLVSASANSGTAVAAPVEKTVTWNGSIAPGGSITITIQATIAGSSPAGSTIMNQGSFSYDGDNNGTNESSVLTNPVSFPVLTTPAITLLTPNQGTPAGGTLVTITGTGFAGAAG